MNRRAQTKLYRARPGQCVLSNRAIRAAARSEVRRRSNERYAQYRAAASNRGKPGAAARSEALPRDSERKKAPLSQASHAHDFLSESESQPWYG
jgi:hypothetical protein